jgi:hypothetical protein
LQTTRPVAFETLESLADRQKLHADHNKQIPSLFRFDLRWILE